MGPIHSTLIQVAVGSSSTLLLPPSETRVSLLLTPHPGTNFSVATQPLSAVGGGVNLLSAAGPVLLRREEFGDLVCQAWYAIATTPQTIGVLVAHEDRSV